jgi:hypothetical protein
MLRCPKANRELTLSRAAKKMKKQIKGDKSKLKGTEGEN